MFRKLPPQGGDPRAVAEVVNGLMEGKSNNTGLITLNTGNATSTTLYNERISPDSVIIVIPASDAAEADTTPYGSFQSLADQTATAANTEYQVTYDTTDFANGVSVVGGTQITVTNAGTYTFLFTTIIDKTAGGTSTITLWMRLNGVDVIGSSQDLSLTNTLPLVFTSGNFTLNIPAGGNIQLCWSSADISVTLNTLPNRITPVRPTGNSVKITLTRIS